MNNFKLDKVDNGYILSITKYDYVTHRPETTILVFVTYDEVVKYLQENKL
jgi:hypothetical protein